MDRSLKLTLCVLLAISFSEATKFYAEPAEFYEDDKNVKVVCTMANETIAVINKVIRMRIEKKITQATWDIAVQINYDEKIDNRDPEAVAKGYVGTGPESYLMMTWPQFKSSKSGTYRCTAVAESPSNDFISRVSQSIPMVGKRRDTHNLYDVVRDGGRLLIQEVQAVKQRTYDAETALDDHFHEAKHVRSNMMEILIRIQTEITQDILKKLGELNTRLMAIEKAVGVNNSPGSS